MGFNPYIGRTKAWLEERLAEAQDELASGVQVISSGSGDVTAAGIAQRSARNRISDLLVALNLLDPAKYPATAASAPTRSVGVMGQVTTATTA